MREIPAAYRRVSLAALMLLTVSFNAEKAAAANLFAGETSSPLGDTVFFTPDANFDIAPFVSLPSGPEQASGIGAYTANSTVLGSAIVYVTEGNTDVISDELAVNFLGLPLTGTPGTETIVATWTSDDDATPGGLGTVPANVFAAGNYLVEDGTVQNVPASDWVDASTGAPFTIPSNITFEAQSDVEAPTAPVAEPASLALYSMGLLCLGALRRRWALRT